MILRIKYIAFIIVAIGIFSSCADDCPECGTPPEVMNFSFVSASGDQDLLYGETLTLDSLDIFYEDKGRIERLNCSVFTDEESKKVYLQSGDVGFLSHRGIHNFEIMHKDKKIGTLDILYMQKSDKERCCTWYTAESVYHDNLPVDLTKNSRVEGTVVDLRIAK